MPQEEINQTSAFLDDESVYGQDTKAVPKPQVGIGIDTNDTFYDNIIQAGESSRIDIAKIESFSQVSQERDLIYALLDTMADDSTISAVLETYAEDATERNDKGQIV